MKLNLIGKKYGRLKVLKDAGSNKYRQSLWLCRCDCGNEVKVSGSGLIKGSTKSCGCLKTEIMKKIFTTHGKWGSPEYRSWAKLKSRCLDKNNTGYKNWGGRGITVCDRWLKFENFIIDMGERPLKTSIDRIDNNKGYYKENCRWATRKEQHRNMRSNVMLTYQGKTLCMKDWSKKLNIKYSTIKNRINCGWDIEKAFNNLKTKQYV